MGGSVLHSCSDVVKVYMRIYFSSNSKMLHQREDPLQGRKTGMGVKVRVT